MPVHFACMPGAAEPVQPSPLGGGGAEPGLDFGFLRAQTIGRDEKFCSPFGERVVTYADYTASGRSLHFVEQQIQQVLKLYANTHTEDDVTGQTTTHILHQAETMIKASVNAGPDGMLVCCSSGATGAITKLQQIIGVYIAPATKKNLGHEIETFLAKTDACTLGEFEAHLASNRPVVFVGPFEHHSNEISWRQCMCTVVEVDLSAEGNVDLDHLQRLLQDPAYDQPGRLRFVSMSAASNVTGIIAPVHDIARIAHAHGAFALFDFAASAPYVRIDMNPLHDPAASLDAVFISPHKFLGGPGACGVLVFNKRMYHGELSPSVAGGGTVTYVTHTQEDYVADVEEREKAGTPGILQTLRAGLAMELKTLVGEDNIQRRELVMLKRAFARWNAHSGVSILGNLDPEKRVGIVSFNVRDPRGRFLHFRLVGALLNDLFGIQSRAGCSCAAPYGHRLLQIDEAATDKLRTQVRHGFNGIKPGWVRVGFHYSMTDEEVDFIIQAVCFVADFGARFIPLYEFNKNSGRWVFAQPLPGPATSLPQFGVANALKLWRTAPPKSDERMSDAARAQAYQAYMSDATKLAERLPEPSPIMAPMCSPAMQQPDEDWKALMFFNLS